MEKQQGEEPEKTENYKREDKIFGRIRKAMDGEPSSPATSISELQDIARTQREERDGWWFTLPEREEGDFEDPLGVAWEKSSRPESHRMFKIVQIKPREQQRATKLGQDSAQAVGTEMMFASLWIIGGVEDSKTGAVLAAPDGFYVRNNRDTAEKWWNDIGPVGQALVQEAFMDKHQPSDKQKATFLRSSRRG